MCGRWIEKCPGAVLLKLRLRERQRATGAIHILHRAITIRIDDFVIVAVADANAFLFFAALGGDQHHAVGSFGTVQSGSSRAFQQVDLGNVGLVDIVDGRSPVLAAADVGEAGLIFERHTIHHDEGLVVGGEVVVATDNDACGATFHAVGRRNLYPRRAPAKRREHVGRVGLFERGTFKTLGGVTYLPLFAFYAQRRHHHTFDVYCLRCEHHADLGTRTYFFGSSKKTHKLKNQCVGRGNTCQCVKTFHIRNGATESSFYKNRHAWYSQSVIGGGNPPRNR